CTRSRGSSLPRPRCLARAASPPPSAIVASFALRSSTSTRIAAALVLNSSLRGLSFDGRVGMAAVSRRTWRHLMRREWRGVKSRAVRQAAIVVANPAKLWAMPKPPVAATPMAFVRAIVMAYEHYGADPRGALRQAQITPSQLRQVDARITAAQME